jgi:hypothetical protein
MSSELSFIFTKNGDWVKKSNHFDVDKEGHLENKPIKKMVSNQGIVI